MRTEWSGDALCQGEVGRVVGERRGLRHYHALDDFLEERQCFGHAVGGLVLQQLLVVLGDGGHEQHGSHILEAVNPLIMQHHTTPHKKHRYNDMMSQKPR